MLRAARSASVGTPSRCSSLGRFPGGTRVRLLRFLYGTCPAYNCSLFFLVRALVHLRFDVALASLRFRPAAQAGALWGLSALSGYPAIVILGGLRRCCSSGNGATLWFRSDRFGIDLGSLLALAMLLCIGVLIMEPYKSYFPNADILLANTVQIASRVICLPTGDTVDRQAVATICAIIRMVVENQRAAPRCSEAAVA